MNQKVLTDGKLSIKGRNSMSGYEYLVLTVLDRYMPKTGRTSFTVKDLKYRMQYKKHGKWQLCMDVSTLKKTLELVTQSNSAIGVIADAIHNEALSIAQVNEGVSQISSVVQTNSASSQESAAVSSELFEQVHVLEAQTNKFKLKQ